MPSKQRISTRADSRDRKRITPKIETNMKVFQIYYNQEKLMNVEIENNKTVKDLNKLLKEKLKDRFYNFLGLESVNGYQVLDYALMTKNYSLAQINQYQKLRILLQGQVYDLHIPTINDFIFIKLLGKGVSSIVYLVRHKQNCKLYALKQVEKTYISDFKKMQFLLREKKILTEIVNKSFFASKIYATFESRDHLNFLLKYYPGGEFFYHLQDRKFNQSQARLYFCQILLAIQSLHKDKIIFRDLKPENVLIDLNGNAVLSDFGLCKTNVKKQQLTTSFCGSDVYMPPQMKEKLGYNYHVDFYTLGAFLFEMITGLPPYYNNNKLTFSQHLSKQVIQLTKKLLEQDINKRVCDFKKIKEYQWLKNIDWQMVKSKQYQMPIKLYLNKSYIHEDFKEEIKFKEIHEPIFDRLFDFFFWISENQNGISQCYVKKNKKMFIESEKCHQKSQKSKNKHQKDSLNKLNKIFQTIPQKVKRSENSLKKDKTPTRGQSFKGQKSKSMKKRSTQNSPYLHKVKNESSLKKQTLNKNNERLSSKDSKQQCNIYQKNIRQVKRIEIKSIKNTTSFNGRSFNSTQKKQPVQSPSFTKRKNF